MRLNTVCVYCQAAKNWMVSSRGINTDDYGAAVISDTGIIKTVMKMWQLMVRMWKKMEEKKMIAMMLMLRKTRR